MVKEKGNRKRHHHDSPVFGWAETEAAKCSHWPCATHKECFSLGLLVLKACPLSRLADMPGEASGQKIWQGLRNGQAPQLSSNLEVLEACGEGEKEKH